MTLVLFDFDGTLTTRDTILPLAGFLLRQNPAKAAGMVRLAWATSLLKLRVSSNHRFKERFCECLLGGETQTHVEELSREFAARYLIGVLREPMLKVVHEHRRAGDEVYIVSSNFDFVLEPLRERLDVNGVIATEPEIVNGRYTGRLSTRACAGSEKVQRALARFGRERVSQAVAYGDSNDDRQLLEFVKTPVWV